MLAAARAALRSRATGAGLVAAAGRRADPLRRGRRRRARPARAARRSWPAPGSSRASRSALLALREETATLPEPLERLGILTLGDLAALPRAALADRFGAPGLLAHDLVGGRDTPLRPRRPGERLEETLELPEAGSGQQLERALGMLIDRLLARRERRGRTLRAVVVSARLVEGGTWRERVVFREALADAERMRLALGGHLSGLPAPAESLRLAAERFGPPHAVGRALFDDDLAQRRARLREAVRQARAAAGPDAALRVLEVDPGSRVPERRAVLAPFEVGPEGGGRPPARRAGDRAAASRPAASRARARARRRAAGAGRGARGRGGPRVLAGRGPLVDRRAAAPPLLGGRHHLRPRRRGLPRPRRASGWFTHR